MKRSPEDAGRDFVAALEAGDWETAAAYMHPDTIARFRKEVETRVADWERTPRAMTAEDYLRREPDMPREVAEYNARKAAEWTGRQRPELPQLLAHVYVASEVPELTGLALFARYIEARDPRYQSRAAYERANRPVPGLESEGSGARLVRTILGAVIEGESTAHVVYRKEWFHGGTPAPLKPVDVLTLERTGAGWLARDFDFSGNGAGVWVDYSVPDEGANLG